MAESPQTLYFCLACPSQIAYLQPSMYMLYIHYIIHTLGSQCVAVYHILGNQCVPVLSVTSVWRYSRYPPCGGTPGRRCAAAYSVTGLGRYQR